jgi:hypothetical protein
MPKAEVRSGDRVYTEGGRVMFLGRENGLINIGGSRSILKRSRRWSRPYRVALVQVSAKSSPITGALCWPRCN